MLFFKLNCIKILVTRTKRRDMSIADFFRPVGLTGADEVRKLIKEKRLEEYNLVDVREPGEYAEGHLPGAVLVPLGELSKRASELDPSKPTVAY